MEKCNYKNCTEDATTKGHIYGHVRGSDGKDSFLPVHACEKHKKVDGFYEEKEQS